MSLEAEDTELYARSWTTNSQRAWLESKKSAFLAARAAGHKKSYLDTVMFDFFEKWPESRVLYGDRPADGLTAEEQIVLGSAIKKRRKQLCVWYKNKSRQWLRSTTTTLAAQPLSTLLEAVGVTKKATKRAPQMGEVYSKQAYQDKIKPVVAASLSAQKEDAGRKLTRAEILNTIKRCTLEVLKNEPDEVRSALREQMSANKLVQMSSAADCPPSTNPIDYQKAIDIAPKIIEHVLAPLVQSMGWTMSLFGAGPVPEDEGKIASMA
ncbi:hypothetical protein C8Q80DRAFT_1103525 [Daedaleopsis nitida]|nr:hypothetical protein C8Q80DRAFT_1103525 [Daedaleopsis nitida]